MMEVARVAESHLTGSKNDMDNTSDVDLSLVYQRQL